MLRSLADRKDFSSCLVILPEPFLNVVSDLEGEIIFTDKEDDEESSWENGVLQDL